MPFPTNEQRAILESNDRLVIVEAAPGSGKTHLFIEFMKLNLTRFVDPRSGIAALSFTNAARDEIQTRLGLVLDSNHFIGTLDAFMYRFVVKPFAPALGLHEHGVRLLAAPLDEEQRSFQVQHGPTARNQASLFSIKFVDGSIAAPVMHVRDRGAYGRPHLVHAEREAPVLRRKHEMWTSHGLITHSDCAYIAAKILSDSVLGPQVIEILSRRFPMILVDEVQDTGRFLSVALTKLLESDRVESLVVGDPDQSIYGFSGANPNLFNELRTIPGAVVYPLTQTQRCSQGICDAASHLSATGRQIVPDADVQPGRQILLVHRQGAPLRLEARIGEVVAGFGEDPGSIAVLSRRNSYVKQLSGDVSDIQFAGISVAGRVFSQAVGRFDEGDALEAYRLASGRLSLILFGSEGMNRSDLESRGVNYATWRQRVFSVLEEGRRVVGTETWNDWLLRIRNQVAAAATEFGVTINTGAAFRRHDDGDAVRSITTVPPVENPQVFLDADFRTIHDSKGAQFDTVVVVMPKPGTGLNRCLSESWFEQGEEQRVGFVALTRAKRNLVLCVHERTYAALQRKQPEFVARFTIETIKF